MSREILSLSIISMINNLKVISLPLISINITIK